MRQLFQAFHFCGTNCSSYRLLNCYFRGSAYRKKEKEGGEVDLNSANLKACKNTSGDLFQAGPTGLSIKLVEGRELDALKKI